jgi:hypothetical protein
MTEEKDSEFDLHQLMVENRASIWLAFVVLVLAATMMQPSFASLVTILLIAAFLFALRWAAHLEGRHSK